MTNKCVEELQGGGHLATTRVDGQKSALKFARADQV
jgi:hypothetical protein